MKTIAIRSGSVVTSDSVEKRDVCSADGVIVECGDVADETIDAAGKLLFPGFIDCHVHFREPGYEHKATMKSEMETAYIGGVTTVCEMPNTDPPTVTIAALADKVRRAEAINADLHFFFGVTQEEHLHALVRLFSEDNEETRRLRSRCCGLKIYLEHSTGDQKIDSALLDDTFKACAEHGIQIVAHCEDPATIEQAMQSVTSTEISVHSLRRPPEAEAASIAMALDLVRTHGTRFHVAHISTCAGLELVRSAKKEGLPVTCEVTTHHLFLTTEDYAELGTFAKVNPPLRDNDDRDALWEGIADGTIDCICTDHAPHTKEEKNAAIPLNAPSGMPGSGTMIPLLLSVAAGHWPHPSSGKPANATLSYSDILRLCFTRPNEIYDLGRTDIASGNTTPIVLIDPSVSRTIHAKDFPSLCGWTPYEGWEVRGSIERVI